MQKNAKKLKKKIKDDWEVDETHLKNI
jgi:hypothetical protein